MVQVLMQVLVLVVGPTGRPGIRLERDDPLVKSLRACRAGRWPVWWMIQLP